MKLLIITQVVDSTHPILGFFHRWIEEFARQCESVEVIALQVGVHSLPSNVTVHSLGKEVGVGRIHYLWRFYRLIWQRRQHYDAVFVHMNQIYVILGAVLWRLLRKRVGLWYMHGTVSPSLRFATLLADAIFTGSKESFRVDSAKVVVTGHGIDTDHFNAVPLLEHETRYDCITVGRISKSKNLEALIRAVGQMDSSTLLIVGVPVTAADQIYDKELREMVRTHNWTDRIRFYGPALPAHLPRLLSSASVFVHTAQNGSLDKTVLEALATGLTVVSTASALKGMSPMIVSTDETNLASVLIQQLQQKTNNTSAREYVIREHGLARLMALLLTYYK